jgi:hypothetical protein
MRINRTVSSADAQVGDSVDFETLDDVRLGDVVVIPKGSTAMATVTEAVPKRRMGRGGKLNMNIDYVRLPSGERLPLRGVQNVKGGGHQGAMTGAMVATGIVFFPAAPLFLFMHGKDITIPKGHEVTVYTNTDYDLAKAAAAAPTPPVTAVAPPAPKPLFGNPLTNEDILKLKDAGLSEQVIVDKIMASPANYRLGADDLVALKKAGISDAIITAMMHAQQAAPAGASVAQPAPSGPPPATPAAAPAPPNAPAAAPQPAPAAPAAELATIVVKSIPDGADITVDGKFVGSTPSTVQLPPGDHTIALEKSGYKSWQRAMTVGAGATITIGPMLEKNP